MLDFLRKKAASLPEAPGVYIMKSKAGDVIYVGKSKKLKNRVSSYFSTHHTSPKTAKLVSQIEDFDYIVCKTEIEALTLENTLIKKHTPKYNIRLKDAKSYPYIKLTNEEFPRFIVTRERHSDGAKYYGPYQSAAVAYSALDTISRVFSLPVCKRSFPRDIRRGRPCIYRDMGRCIAPCTGEVSLEDYLSTVKLAEGALAGNIAKTEAELREKMQRHAELLEFEKAGAVRDSILALAKLKEKQKVVADEKIERDVFSLISSETESALAVLNVRQGSLINKSEFILSLCDADNDDEMISLIANYYENASVIPKEVMLDFKLEGEEAQLLCEYLSLLAGRKISVKLPERGDGRALCEMARKNAEEALRQHRLGFEREDKTQRELASLLGLAEIPRRIEAYDISNVGDENIVASMVVFDNGRAKKSDYRSFKITTTNGRNDYGSMEEALSRRLSHIGKDAGSLGSAPDLILLDGGAGHVRTVLPLVRERGLEIPVFGMVKDDYHKTRALTNGEADISIAHDLNVYGFIYKIQEEAHRFAYNSSQNAKKKTLKHSTLENIKGIGPKKAKLLLAAKSISEIRVAQPHELAAIRGISEEDARSIYEYFKKRTMKK